VSGSVLRRTNDGYDRARLLFDERFDGVMPTAVAQVTSAADIAYCLDFAQRFGLGLRTRSGGHSYIGASTGPGLVIDLRRLSTVEANADATATIGPHAGCRSPRDRVPASGSRGSLSAVASVSSDVATD
jgi:FAD/FMN-containing dehydrogenase